LYGTVSIKIEATFLLQKFSNTFLFLFQTHLVSASSYKMELPNNHNHNNKITMPIRNSVSNIDRTTKIGYKQNKYWYKAVFKPAK